MVSSHHPAATTSSQDLSENWSTEAETKSVLSIDSSDTSSIIYIPPSPTLTMSSTTSAAPSHSTTSSDTPPAPAPAGAANISVREYIYFLPHPVPPNTPVPYSIHLPDKNPLNLPDKQFEPTSTLVLTSPNRTFVDLRFYKPTHPKDAPLPNHGERARLEWGFAGSSTSVPTLDKHVATGDAPWEKVTHTTWTHWLDSRHPVGASDIPIDEGDMYPISATLTLEVGAMYQPAMRCVKAHEEMWRDVDAVCTNATGSKVCVVLRVRDDEARVRGVVVRVGQYVQGIVMLGEYVTVERWEFDEKRELEGTEGEGEMDRWVRTAKVGDQFLPCLATVRLDVLSVGGRVKYHDYEWDVEEVWEWV